MKPTVFVFLLLLAAPFVYAQSRIDAAARKDIEAGNQAWVDGMKSGNMAGVIATYADDAVDCSPSGECVTGRDAIEKFMNERIAKLGKATSALVTSAGSVQQGDFVYEWGRARAEFRGRRTIAGRYLTAWRREPDGSWKIFRNLSIPADRVR